jgi:hypothetical protein
MNLAVYYLFSKSLKETNQILSHVYSNSNLTQFYAMKKLLLPITCCLMLVTTKAQEHNSYKKKKVISISTTPLSPFNPDRYLPVQFKVSNLYKKIYLQANIGYLWRTGSFLKATNSDSPLGTTNVKQNGIYTELEFGKYLRSTRNALGGIAQYKVVNCTFDAPAGNYPVLAGSNKFGFHRYLLATTYTFLMPGRMSLLNSGVQVAAGATYKQYVSNGVNDINNGDLNEQYISFLSTTGFFPYLHLRCIVGLRF